MYRRYLPWHIDRRHRTVVLKAPEDDRELENRIVLLNWNTHKNNHTREWLEDFSSILRRYRPDLIAFQEFRTLHRKSVLDAHREYGYAFVPNMVWRERCFGLINAAKSPIIDVDFYLSEGVEPLVKTPKTLLETRYRTAEGTPLRLINVHMINFVRLRTFLLQLEQLESVLSKDTAPLILAGDFNTWNKVRLLHLKHLTDRYGLNSVRFESEKHKKALLPYPLDHVFYRHLYVQKSEVLSEITASDHKPMVVTFAYGS